MDKKTEFSLAGHPYVELSNLLKYKGLCTSGGMAKGVIADGRVKVDGKVEFRKRCKILAGQVVDFEGVSIKVIE